MLFALICHDKPGARALRMDTRADHLAHVERSGVVVQAGPFLDDDGGMIGSLVILDVADRAAAQAWADADPYARAGLFDRVEIMAWTRVIGG